MDLSLDVQTREFEAYIDRITRGMEPEVLRKTLVRTAFDFIGSAVKLTPVDTGRARSGWTPWVDAHPTPPGKTKPTVQGSGVAQGKSDGSYREDLTGADQSIEITNGVPYIVALEYGHSQQSTAAARISMRRAREKIDGNALIALSAEIRDADMKTRGIRG